VSCSFLTITRDVYYCCRRGEDGNGGGDPKGKNTNTAPDPKKMSTFERGMLCYMQGITADAIARGEGPPCNGLYAPPDMHHYLRRNTADAIARGEEPPYGCLYASGGLYSPLANPSVANPPTKKGTKKDKPSSSQHKDR
jgi:hypothetical protein